MIYRSHLGLARLDFVEARYDAALEQLIKSLEDNPSYLPTHALLGRVKLAKGDADGAIESLAIVLKDPELADTDVFLAYAQALATRAEVGAEGIGDEDVAQALEMLRKAKDRGARPEQITPIVELIADPAIAEEFGVKLKKK